MNSNILPVSVLLLAGLLGASIASATGIQNGDFENATDLEHWTAVPLAAPDANNALVEEIDSAGDDQLHLMARNTYTWGGGVWAMDQFLGSIAQSTNPADYDLYAPAGTTALQFDAKIDIQILSGDSATRVWAKVDYNFGETIFDATEALTFSASSDWATYVLDLPGLDVSKLIDLNIYARSGDGLVGPVGESEGQTVDLVAEAWFDNFQFIPEPISAVMLAIGGVGLVLRKRPR